MALLAQNRRRFEHLAKTLRVWISVI